MDGKEVEVYQESPTTLDDIVDTMNTPEFNNQFYGLTEDDLPHVPKVRLNNSGSVHIPTKHSRLKVRMMKIAGIENSMVAECMNIGQSTLFKHYRKDLDCGLAECVTLTAGKLIEKIRSGDNTALIFFLRTRGRWAPKNNMDEDKNHLDRPRNRSEIVEELKLLGIPEESMEELLED